jgi:ClpP class serine protease
MSENDKKESRSRNKPSGSESELKEWLATTAFIEVVSPVDYDAIKKRLDDALAKPEVEKIILTIDTPGS